MVIGSELMVDLDIESRAIRAVNRWRHQVLVRTQLVDKTGSRVGGRERIVREEIVCHRIKSVLGNDVARERGAGPGSVRVLANGSRIVNDISTRLACWIKEIEVAVQHIRAGHIAGE